MSKFSVFDLHISSRECSGAFPVDKQLLFFFELRCGVAQRPDRLVAKELGDAHKHISALKQFEELAVFIGTGTAPSAAVCLSPFFHRVKEDSMLAVDVLRMKLLC